VLGKGVLPMTEATEVTARLDHLGQAAAVLSALTERGVELAQFDVGNPSLDEVFLALTGRAAEDSSAEATA
jgi:ABC-2 type transport system ATP-binding protein